MPERKKLPATRKSITHKVTIAGVMEIYFTVGLYENGKPAEIFIRNQNGSMIEGLCEAWAIALSLLLQDGHDLKHIIQKFSYMQFEPMGMTGNPDLPSCKSIIDYIARWLEMTFVKKEKEL